MNVDYGQAYSIDAIRGLAKDNPVVQMLFADYYAGEKSAKYVIDVIAALCHLDLVERTSKSRKRGNGFD